MNALTSPIETITTYAASLTDGLFSADRFAQPWAFALVPIAVAITALALRPGHFPSLVLPTADRVRPAGRGWRSALVAVPPFVRLLAVLALLVAFARPQSVVDGSETSTEAVALQLCIDRSSSMNERVTLDGETMTRLAAVKRVAREFMLGADANETETDAEFEGRPGDLIGVTVFAGFAETICPPVREHDAVVDLLERVKTADRLLRDDGTAVGDGLQSAVARLIRLEQQLKEVSEREGQSGGGGGGAADFTLRTKAVILMTDGQSNQGIAPQDAIDFAVENGIRVYTIGIGASSEAGGVFGLLRRSAVDDRLLREIAAATGGRFWLAESAEALREIYAEIDSLERTVINSESFVEYDELYHPWAVLGLGLLTIELLLRTVLLRRLP